MFGINGKTMDDISLILYEEVTKSACLMVIPKANMANKISHNLYIKQ